MLCTGLLGSLERLQLDYVDIVLITRDPDRICTIEEIVRACTFAVQQGWAFYWGTSNWSPEDIMEAHAVARLFHLIPPSMECLEFNLFQREFHECGLPEICSKLGLGLVSGAPLARGLLSGKYEERIPQYSRASLQVCLNLDNQLESAWCLKSNQVNSVILGAATVDQLQENLGALSAVTSLTNAVLGEIENILISDHQSTEEFL
nr:voltage gated potassium channel subunit [Hymenolepis microstoma]